MPNPRNEIKAFDLFKYQLGQVVVHRASAQKMVIINRELIQASTGNTGRRYYVNCGGTPYRFSEIELATSKEWENEQFFNGVEKAK